MQYLLLSVVSIATIMSVTGKIPDYIKICKRNDPEVARCISNSVLGLKDKLVLGIPELKVPPIDPFYLDKLSMNLGTGFRCEGRNLQVNGGKNFKILNIVSDVAASIFSFDISFPKAIVTGEYIVDAALGIVPIKGTGPLSVNATSIIGQGTLFGKKAVRGGKTYLWFPSMNLKLQIGDYKIKLENLFNGDPVIGEATNKLLNEEKTEVLNSLIPSFERAVIELALSTANNITKNFTWDELFPAT